MLWLKWFIILSQYVYLPWFLGCKPSFFWFDLLSFLVMVRPIDKAPICLSLKEFAVCADHEVLMEIEDNISLIVGDT
jgi:hypothetical protein